MGDHLRSKIVVMALIVVAVAVVVVVVRGHYALKLDVPGRIHFEIAPAPVANR
jgi:hypothetical protein